MTRKNNPKHSSLRDVFDVAIRFDGLPLDAVAARAAQVEKEIANLAQREKLSVVFHRFVDEGQLGGCPSVLVDMPAALTEKVKALPHVSHVGKPHLPTEPRT